MIRKTLGWGAYLVFLAVFFEVSFRILFNVPQVIYMLPFNDSFEVKWYYWWVNRYQVEGVDIYFSYDDYHETLGWVTKPNLTRYPSDVTDNTLTTNSHGLRMTYDVPYENEDGKQRILILGDSFTFGETVNDDENFPYLLDQKLPDSTVINMGIHGYGHDQMLLYFQEEGVKYNPDIVVLAFLSADVSRNVISFRDAAKPKFELEDEELILTNVPVPRPNEVMEQSYYRSRVKDVGRIFYDVYRERTGRLKAEQEAVTIAIMDEIVRQTEEIGAIPMLIYMPWGEEITSDAELVEWEEFMLAYCADRAIEHCFSVRSDFQAGLAQGIEYDMGHWLLPGNTTVADGMFNYLRAEKLVE